jgi:hypothetical protein
MYREISSVCETVNISHVNKFVVVSSLGNVQIKRRQLGLVIEQINIIVNSLVQLAEHFPSWLTLSITRLR